MHIITKSGKRVSFVDPQPNQIDIDDIAWALAHQNRYNGHTSRPYSVAEHSIRLVNYLFTKLEQDVQKEAPRLLMLYALLHDAPEAYIGDIVYHLKGMVPGFKEIEDNIMSTILTALVPDAVEALGNPIITDTIHRVDRRISFDEMYALCAEVDPFFGQSGVLPLQVKGIERLSTIKDYAYDLEHWAGYHNMLERGVVRTPSQVADMFRDYFQMLSKPLFLEENK